MNKIKKTFLAFVIILIMFLLCSLFLTGCVPIDKSDVINNLLPNIWVFCGHIFATVFLLIIIIWLVWKPTKTALAKRHNYIQNEINEAERARKEAFLKLQEAEKAKLAAFQQAKTIVENATDKAYIAKEKIESEAKLIAKKVIGDAKNQAIILQEQIKQDNEQNILDIAFNATEALLKKNISNEDNQKLVKDFIDKLSSKEAEKVNNDK